MPVNKNIMIEGARIGFRNFEGREGQFNAKGNRNFSVFLEAEHARMLQEDGWNIKWLRPRSEDDEPQAHLPVAVSFAYMPPKIVIVKHQEKRALTEETIQILDWAEIANVDIVVRPYNWEVGDKSGVKAYVKSLYITLAEDEFEKKYHGVPDGTVSVEDPNSDLPF